METKEFEFFKYPITYRPGTSDEAIINQILIERKEYLFPMGVTKIIFDIGSNIGVTAVLMANLYPEAKIHCFEPEPENYQLLIKNTEYYPNITIYNKAVENYNGVTTLFSSDDSTNLGGFSTNIKPERETKLPIHVETVRMMTLCDTIGTPELIKIDCEGAEYAILTDIPQLEKVQWITGELHGVWDFALLDRLSKHFKIATNRTFEDKVWHFHAMNRHPATASSPTAPL